MKPSPLRSYIALALVTGCVKYCSMLSKSSIVMTLSLFDGAKVAENGVLQMNPELPISSPKDNYKGTEGQKATTKRRRGAVQITAFRAACRLCGVGSYLCRPFSGN